MEENMTKEMEKIELKNHVHDHDHQIEKEEDQAKNIGGKKNEHKTTLRTPADIYEHPSSYAFILDMPGLDAQNIKVKVDNGILHVSGKKKKKQIIGEPSNAAAEGVKVIRIERRRARYMRKFTLPADASPEDVKAAYKDGVLSITVAKTKLSDVEVEQSKILTNVSIS